MARDGSNVCWMLADHQGTIRDVVASDGALQLHRTYDAFGNVSEFDSGGQSQAFTQDFPFAYTGRPYDAATGLYDCRARWYDPAVGRFVSQDPISFAGGDMNLYRYVGNNPMVHVDPSGLCYGGLAKYTGFELTQFGRIDYSPSGTPVGLTPWSEIGSAKPTPAPDPQDVGDYASLIASRTVNVGRRTRADIEQLRQQLFGAGEPMGVAALQQVASAGHLQSGGANWADVLASPSMFRSVMRGAGGSLSVAMQENRKRSGGPISTGGAAAEGFGLGFSAGALTVTDTLTLGMTDYGTQADLYMAEAGLKGTWTETATKWSARVGVGSLYAATGLQAAATIEAGGLLGISNVGVVSGGTIPATLYTEATVAATTGTMFPAGYLYSQGVAPAVAASSSVLPPSGTKPRIQSPGKISGNPANTRLPTGVPLKNKLWWRERWYRITPEDAQAYRNATADFQSELSKATRWLPDAERRVWHRAEMSQFRTDWLKNFLETRPY